MRTLDFGVFLPIANNGWIISTTAPQYMPTFALNREITLRAERLGFDFVLSMVKWRGYGGPTEHWDYAMESFTLMAGLAAITQRLDLYASVALPTLHPAIVARMVATIDDISGGRFGLNIVTGWNKSEYTQMGLWRGDEYFSYRYDYATEYVQILKLLWEQGRATFQGQYFQLEDCLCQPQPSRRIPIVCAGESDRGLTFTAQMGDRSFISGDTVLNMDRLAEMSQKVKRFGLEQGREVGTYALVMVVAAETDAAAQSLYQSYIDGGDLEALQGRVQVASADQTGATSQRLKRQAVMGPTIVGSYQTVADYFDRIADQTQVEGVLLTFPEFIQGVTQFGEQVMPLMRNRSLHPVSI